MIYSIHVRPEAEVDIEEAAQWYENQQKHLGHDFLDELLTTVKTISENPSLYPKIYRQTHRVILSRFPFGVYYRLENNSIVIVAVMHGSRHPRKWKKRK